MLRKNLSIAAVVIACVGIAFVGLSSGVLTVPIVRVPPPGGPWAVGTTTLGVGSGPGFGATVAQIWYPSRPRMIARRAPYLFRSRRPLRARLFGAIVRTNSHVDVPIAGGRFPVVIYIAGWGGLRENNTALSEELASRGYIVAAISDAFPERPLDFSSIERSERSVAWADRKVRLESQIVKKLLDTLEAANETTGSRFKGHLDVDHLGALGFSFGGAVAAEATRVDPRLISAINLDGWMFGETLRSGVERPFLLVSGDDPVPSPRNPAEDRERRVLDDFDRRNGELQFAGIRRRGGFIVIVKGMNHYNFTDAAWLPTVRRTGLGKIDAHLGIRIVSAYVVQFFDRTLKKKAAPLYDSGKPLDDAVKVLRFGNNFAQARGQ